MKRRLPGLVVVLAALIGIVVAARTTSDADVADFSVAADGWMPSAPPVDGITETWFCPGVPATGADGVRGEVTIANRGEEPLAGSILVINDSGAVERRPITVAPWGIERIDLTQIAPSAMTGAVVEIEDGGAVVEQIARHPAGDSVAPCANATSDRWYFADGFTVEGSLDQIVLTNPFEQPVVVNLSFATREGPRQPASYRGITVPAQGIRVIDLGAPGAGAQSEPQLAVAVEAARGRLVVGRSQRFLGGGRLGAQVSLGSPALRDQWWFADAVKAPGVTETYQIYNPTDDDVTVDVVMLSGDFVDVPSVEVPAREVVAFDLGATAEIPEGDYAIVFATLQEPSIVVERVRTTTNDDGVATTVVVGATGRQDAYIASTWYVPLGPSAPTENGLVVFNIDSAPQTVSVSVIGVSGPVVVPGLEAVTVEAAKRVSIDLVDPLVVDRPLLIQASGRIFVERSTPSGRAAFRSSAWAVPAG